jgi:hypothetical protein
LNRPKPAIRNNFGVGRFNTRLNFYLFEINRLSFIQRKSFHNHRFISNVSNRKLNLNLLTLSSPVKHKVNFVFEGEGKGEHTVGGVY